MAAITLIAGIPVTIIVHDRDGSYGAVFGKRVRSLGIRQIRTPVKAPRWVRSIRAECLDHMFVFGHQHLQRSLKRVHRVLQSLAPPSKPRSMGTLFPKRTTDQAIERTNRR